MLKKLFSCLLILFVSGSVLTGGLIEADAEDSVSYGITLDPDEIFLIEGDSAQITATVVPEDLEIVWSSSNESYATVDQTGVVTGIKAGPEVAITARSKDGKHQATCWVYVVEEERAKGQCGEKAFWELTWRGVLTISGEGKVSGHGEVSESGEWVDGGANHDFVWEKYGPDVKTIIINEGITVLPDYVFSFPFWYQNWDYNEDDWCDEYFFRNLKSITIPKSVEKIGTYGFSYLFNLEEVFIDENNPAYCADDHFVYTKDRKTIVRAFGLQEEFIIPEGVGYLEADAFGDLQNLTTIQFPSTIIRINPTITDGAKNFKTVKGYENTIAKEFADKYGYEFISLGICELPEISEIVLNKTSMELIMGNTEKLTASVVPENADAKSLSWSSSDPSAASVDEEGNVTGVDVGTAVITVTADNGISASCNVKVYNPDYPDELHLNRASLALLPGKSFRLTANGYERVIPLTWTSSDPDVATVSSSGAVLAKVPGNTAITAAGGGLSASCELRVLFTDV
ncbi:MAG: Ig-like domain-containing protein, partial [Erysipelotrichaceae bacterium]|nr:Ig-like domain-containing protein [Erysipelotrichaceae bacterium]